MDFSKQPAAGPRVFKGYLATATLHPDRVEFKRKLIAKVGGNRDAVIPLATVLKIFSKGPTRTLNGFVHLATAEDQGQLRTWAESTDEQVAGNPRAIMFTWGQRDTYAEFLAVVDQAWRAQEPPAL